jgi:hypothetical protein
MKKLVCLSLLTLFLINPLSAQEVPNVSFSDNEGESYELYKLLEANQSVVFHYTSTG